MDLDLILQQINERFFDTILAEVRDFVSEVDNLDLRNANIELNEVTSAFLSGIDIRGANNLIIEDGDFSVILTIEGAIDLEDQAYGKTVDDFVELFFNVSCSGVINVDSIVEQFSVDTIEQA